MSDALPLFDRKPPPPDDAKELDRLAASTEEALAAAGDLLPFDRKLASTLSKMGGETRGSVHLAVAWVSQKARDGHACVPLSDLASLLGQPVVIFRAALSASPLVGGEGSRATPLVLDGHGRLYLRRHWEDEEALARSLRAALGRTLPPIRDRRAVRASVERLFPAASASGVVDPQRIGAVLPLLRGVTVITGGPGTGKTSTVVRLLAIDAEEAARCGETRRVILLAPTGKAAARLVESIRAAKEALPVDEAIKNRIPETASTIHRALRPKGIGAFGFLHGPERPLACDLAVVDEASMIDLSLMRALVDALPDHARLVLLGDRDQLASIDVGSLLGDLVPEEPPRISAELAGDLEELVGGAPPRATGVSPPLGDAIVVLERTYRFGGAIAEFARAIQAGDGDAAERILRDGTGGVEGRAITADASPASAALSVVAFAKERYAFLRGAGSPESVLEKLERFRVLCAHRHGPLGSLALSQALEAALFRDDPTGQTARPILIVENDPLLGLANGDVGILGRGEDARVRAFFREPLVRSIPPSRLPPYESALAMSVHKSQGSQFDEVLVVLPQRVSLVLSRELLYTAVTRARTKVTIVGPLEVVRAAIARPIARASGLREKLWG